MRLLHEFPLAGFPRLTHLGSAVNLQADEVAEHRHIGYEIIYFAEGSADVMLHSTQRLKVIAGDILIVAPGVSHCFSLTSKNIAFSWLGYQTGAKVYRGTASALPGRSGGREDLVTELEEVISGPPVPLGPIADLPVVSYALVHEVFTAGRIFSDLIEEMDHQDEHQATIMGLLVLQLFSRIARQMGEGERRLPGGPTSTFKGQLDLIRQLEAFIVYHLEEDLSLETLAKFVGYNPSYLSRFYHSHTGRNLSDFIRDIRIHRAKALLRTGISVTLAAEKSGFHSIHHFSTVFKQKEGISPSQYRDGTDVGSPAATIAEFHEFGR